MIVAVDGMCEVGSERSDPAAARAIRADESDRDRAVERFGGRIRRRVRRAPMQRPRAVVRSCVRYCWHLVTLRSKPAITYNSFFQRPTVRVCGAVQTRDGVRNTLAIEHCSAELSMFRRDFLIVASVLALVSAGPGFAQDKQQKRVEKQKADMRQRADEGLEKLFKEVAGSKQLYDKAAGYAVISVTKAGFFVSGSGGSGVAVDKAAK